MARTGIKWHPAARSDIARLAEFLRGKQPGAAARAMRTIMDGATLLESAPRLGRPLLDGTDRRELSVNFGAGAYILRYLVVEEETILILRVRHSREERVD